MKQRTALLRKEYRFAGSCVVCCLERTTDTLSFRPLERCMQLFFAFCCFCFLCTIGMFCAANSCLMEIFIFYCCWTAARLQCIEIQHTFVILMILVCLLVGFRFYWVSYFITVLQYVLLPHCYCNNSPTHQNIISQNVFHFHKSRQIY